MAENGQTATWEAAMSKTFSGELMQHLGEAALDLLGTGATLSQGALGAITDGRLEHMLRHSIMIVVGGGTNEIQRTLIAQRGLNLPR
jgi:alkylation response protein AidB-like acyl-CoA dehydrogenase